MPKFNVAITHAIPQSATAIAREQQLQKLRGGKTPTKRKAETRLTLEAANEADLPGEIVRHLFYPQEVFSFGEWQPAYLTRLAEVDRIGRMPEKSRPKLPVVKLVPQDWIRHFGRQPHKTEICLIPLTPYGIDPPNPDTAFLWRLEAAPKDLETGALF